jgi:hypothetical protein
VLQPSLVTGLQEEGGGAHAVAHFMLPHICTALMSAAVPVAEQCAAFVSMPVRQFMQLLAGSLLQAVSCVQQFIVMQSSHVPDGRRPLQAEEPPAPPAPPAPPVPELDDELLLGFPELLELLVDEWLLLVAV